MYLLFLRMHLDCDEDIIVKYFKRNKYFLKDFSFHDLEVLKYFDFIREFQDLLDWEWIPLSQNLSEDFIREFQDLLDWQRISRYQKLSEGFIREFKNQVDWVWILCNQKLSEEFISEFKHDMGGFIEFL